MSDLYLDLKRRIPVVTDWTDVGTEEMERAQQRTGLSDEKLAHRIPVSAKTWVRWKRRGQIPTHLLPKVAPILGFEMVRLRRRAGHRANPPFPPRIRQRSDPKRARLSWQPWWGSQVTETDRERREKDQHFDLTVLAIIGWVLPLAGILWGPGEWWHYLIWLGIGTAALIAYERFEMTRRY